MNAYNNIINIVDGPNYHGRRLIPKPPGIPEKTQHAAIAGAIGGYCIWGNYTSINYQIVLYLTSRIIVGLTTLAREKNIPPFHWIDSVAESLTFTNTKNKKKNGVLYPLNAALVWSIVMILFESCPYVLHPSLTRSMDDIYHFDFFKNRYYGDSTRSSSSSSSSIINNS